MAASIAADHGGRAVGVVLDAGDRAGIAEVTARVAAQLGPITVLVNNAAYNIMGPIFDYDPDDWDRVLAVNLSGPWFLSRQVMRQMRDAGGGVIVNISSYAPDVGGMGLEAPYAVSKGGLNVLTRSCAHEGGPHGIRVNTVTMGMVTGTRFIDELHADMTAPEIARARAAQAAAHRRHRRDRVVPGLRPGPQHHRRDDQRRRRRAHALVAPLTFGLACRGRCSNRSASSRSAAGPPCTIRPLRSTYAVVASCSARRANWSTSSSAAPSAGTGPGTRRSRRRRSAPARATPRPPAPATGGGRRPRPSPASAAGRR